MRAPGARRSGAWRPAPCILMLGLVLVLLGGAAAQHCSPAEIAWPAAQCTQPCPVDLDPCSQGQARGETTTVCLPPAPCLACLPRDAHAPAARWQRSCFSLLLRPRVLRDVERGEGVVGCVCVCVCGCVCVCVCVCACGCGCGGGGRVGVIVWRASGAMERVGD